MKQLNGWSKRYTRLFEVFKKAWLTAVVRRHSFCGSQTSGGLHIPPPIIPITGTALGSIVPNQYQ